MLESTIAMIAGNSFTSASVFQGDVNQVVAHLSCVKEIGEGKVFVPDG